VQQASASIVELDTILAHYGPEASESRQKLREVVAAAAEQLWPNGGVLPPRLGPPVKLAESATFYESIANLSPHTEAQHFIQNRALATSASVRQMRPLMLEQMGSSTLGHSWRSLLSDFDVVSRVWPFRADQRDSGRRFLRDLVFRLRACAHPRRRSGAETVRRSGSRLSLGFKLVKWITAIEFVHGFADLGAGQGGYNEDHEFYGYRMPI
jgi:hypothetical protein